MHPHDPDAIAMAAALGYTIAPDGSLVWSDCCTPPDYTELDWMPSTASLLKTPGGTMLLQTLAMRLLLDMGHNCCLAYGRAWGEAGCVAD